MAISLLLKWCKPWFDFIGKGNFVSKKYINFGCTYITTPVWDTSFLWLSKG